MEKHSHWQSPSHSAIRGNGFEGFVFYHQTSFQRTWLHLEHQENSIFQFPKDNWTVYKKDQQHIRSDLCKWYSCAITRGLLSTSVTSQCLLQTERTAPFACGNSSRIPIFPILLRTTRNENDCSIFQRRGLLHLWTRLMLGPRHSWQMQSLEYKRTATAFLFQKYMRVNMGQLIENSHCSVSLFLNMS